VIKCAKSLNERFAGQEIVVTCILKVNAALSERERERERAREAMAVRGAWKQ
jgi:hypothetical protein